MTVKPVTPAAITQHLAAAWPGTAVDGEPMPLTGGFWASMYRLHLTGQPPSVPPDVVLRIAPDHAMGAKELAVQRAAGEQGFATPRIRLSGPADEAIGGTWSVMDFVSGTPPLGDLDGLAALRRAPALLTGLPRLLAGAMAALHALDPEPATAAVRAAAPSVAWQVQDLFGSFETGATRVDRPDLIAVIDALATTMPRPGQTVLCHGDIHPFNVLVDGDGATTVIDWTSAIRANPDYDVAFTALLLANPPLDAPRPVGAVISRVGQTLARRFISTYRRLAPGHAVASIGWYQALHGTRILLETALHQASNGADPSGHPFAALSAPAAAAVRAATGIDIAVRR